MKRFSARRLFVGALLVYSLNLRPIPSGDTLPAALLPLQLVLHGRVTFDPLAPMLRESYDGKPYFLHEKAGHFYSTYPIAQPLLLTPLYLPLALVPGSRSWTPPTELLAARILEKILASVIAAASVAVFFLLLRRLTTERRALLLAVIYGFATNTWSTSSQALWQHGASQFAITGSLLYLVRYLEDPRRRRAAILAGLFAALSVAFRPTDLLFFAASFGVIAFLPNAWSQNVCLQNVCLQTAFLQSRDRKGASTVSRTWLLSAYAGFGALTGGALAWYNLAIFGHLRGGYTQPFDGNFWTGLAGLTVSPSHGLFVYSPILLFAVAGAWLGWRRSQPTVVLWPISVLFIASQIAVLSFWRSWFGGDCYGPRLLADVLPCMVLLIVGALDWVARHRPRQVAFAAALVFSVTVQIVGVFSYPLGFRTPEPLWDWAHAPFIENARHGPVTAHYRVAGHFVWDLLHGRKPDIEHTGLRVR